MKKKVKSKTQGIAARPDRATVEALHRALVGESQLVSVLLTKAQSELRTERLIGDIENLVLTILPPAYKFSVVDDENALLCGSRLTAILTPSDGQKVKERAVVEITGEYLLRYLIPPEAKEQPAEAFMLFASRNGVFNAWPFFRELVHSFAGRMDIPALVLPLLRMPLFPASDRAATAPLSAPPPGRVGSRKRKS
jgi:hypothetical protein